MGILRGKYKKPILWSLLVVVILAAGYAALAWFFGFFPFEERAAIREKGKVESAFQDPESSCSDETLSRAEKVYGEKLTSVDKGLVAKQIGTCYSVKQNFDKAIEWFKLAQGDYQAAGKEIEVSEMRAAVENAEYFKNAPKVPEGPAQYEDRGEL